MVFAGAITAISVLCPWLLDRQATLLVEDCATLLAGAIAASACWWKVNRGTSAERAWSMWMAIGLTGWSLGAGAWMACRYVLHITAANRSPADIAFLVLPVAALAALACLAQQPHSWRRQGWTITLLDSLAVIGSVLVVIWSTDLHTVLGVDAGGRTVSLPASARPALNLVVVVVVLLLWLTRRATAALRTQLALLGLGLIMLAGADWFSAYQAVMGSPRSPLSSALFIGGALLITLAASASGRSEWGAAPAELLPRARAWLPYVGLAAMVTVIAVGIVSGRRLDPVSLGWSVSIVILAREVVALKKNQARQRELVDEQLRLTHLAQHDPLTGVANRAFLRRQLEQELAIDQQTDAQLGLLLIDVDDFKSINDRFGHVAGDDLLVHLADRLTKCVRKDDVVARIGGDEFVVVLRSEPWPAAVSRRILDAVQRPYLIRGRWVPVSVSMGLVELGHERADLSPEGLLDRVDAAMYQAKRSRGPMLVSYDINGREAEAEWEQRPDPGEPVWPAHRDLPTTG